MKTIIRKEQPKDYIEISEVIKSAFFRKGKDIEFNEWVLVENIRKTDYYINELSLVAEINGKILGHIMFTPLKIKNKNQAFDSLALAPVSVKKEYQKQGIGKKLVISGIEKGKELGYQSIVVLGQPEYYPKFGFKPASNWKIGLTSDFNDDCLFVLELLKGSLNSVTGIIQYCPPFYNEDGELI